MPISNPDDVCRCMIMGRESPSKAWNPEHDLIVICERKSVAWRSAYLTEQQERKVLGHKKFECIVVLEEDFDSGKFNRLNPPKNFKFE